MREVKFSAFADFHYWPGVFYAKAEQLDEIIKRAKENKVDFIVHLGDLCHKPSDFSEFIGRYESAPLPTYHVIGNHEFENNTLEQILEAYHLEKPYYYFDKNGFRFIVLDLNCMRINGEAVHYSNGNCFREKHDSLVTFDEAQLEWFEKTVRESPHMCVILSHHSLERKYSGMSFAENDMVKELINRLNSDKTRIIMAVNGHYHRDNLIVRDNVAYLDLNSTSGEWLSKKHEGVYPKEVYENIRYAANNVFWEEPIHAIITIREDGYIKIEGMESRYIYGVDHKSLGLSSIDSDGRACTPRVSTSEIKLKLK